MIRRRLILACILALAAATGLAAQENPEALQFARGERNPRNAAFAGAGAASAYSPAYAALRGNAAMIPLYGGTLDAGAAYQKAKPGNEYTKSNNFQAGVAGKIGLGDYGNLGLALGAAYDSYEPVGFFTPSGLLVALGAAYGIGNNFGIGVSARYAKESITENISYGAFSADITASARFAEDFTAIVGVAMLGPRVQGSAESYPQPAHALAALAWRHVFEQKHSLEIMADAEYCFEGSFGASAGIEYGYSDMVFVRGGFRAGTPALPSHCAAGLGFKYFGIRLDASYIFASEILGNGLSVGLGYSF